MADDLRNLNRFINRFGTTIARNAKRIERVVLSDVLGRYKNRIFNRGLASDGRQIGQYSTKPILIGAKSFRTRSQANKVLGSKKNRSGLSWVTIGGKRLAELEGGYKELRSKQGLETSKVNLQYRDDLFRSIQLGTNSGDSVIGFTGPKDDLQRKKAEGNETRFKKKIFEITKGEQKAIDKAFLRELDKLLIKIK